MAYKETDSVKSLQQEIRRQFGSAATMRFAKSLPAFRIEHSVPDRFLNLLDELDRAEADGPGGDVLDLGLSRSS